MVENVSFPVFVLSRDRGAMRKYSSIQELYKALERIDVENREYDAWDSEGFHVEMLLRDGKDWLGLKRTTRGMQEFKNAIVRFAGNSGVVVDPASMTADNPVKLYEGIDEAIAARVREMPWYRRFLRRF